MSHNAGCEIVTSRMFNVPREQVFKAWTDPDHLKQWWGPKGFTNTFSEFDLKPGGYWRFIMSGPDGVDYRNESVFVEIVPPARLVFDHISGHRFRVTALFAGHPGKCALTWSMVFDSPEECEMVRSAIEAANEQNLDRLEAHLETMRRS